MLVILPIDYALPWILCEQIRSVLEVGDDRYLIRGFLVDLSLRITKNITSGSTLYALQKAG